MQCKVVMYEFHYFNNGNEIDTLIYHKEINIKR